MKTVRLLIAPVVLLTVVGGCGGGTGDGGAATASGRSACLVVTDSGVNDRSFNQAAWEGVQAGARSRGLEPKYVQVDHGADYISAIKAFARQPCAVIVTNGFAMKDATEQVAKSAAGKRFVIVDVAFEPVIPNVRGLLFDAGQPAFLAGYLAAGISRTGVVATYGGINIQPLTLFMDGYALGIEHYNTVHGAGVRLLGWDRAAKSGTFVGSFTDQAKGKQIVKGFIDQGADVVLTLAGLADQGAIAAARESGSGKVKLVWPNTDGCKQLPTACDLLVTSVMKNITQVTQQTVENAVTDSFTGGTYVGTLMNGGVGISPLVDVPAELAAEVEQLRQKIISGEITVRSEGTPRTS